MVPTAVATCAALGVGGSPKGVILHSMENTNLNKDKMETLWKIAENVLKFSFWSYLDHLLVITS